MRRLRVFFLFTSILTGCTSVPDRTTGNNANGHEVQGWITAADQSALLEKIPSIDFTTEVHSSDVITIDTASSYQMMDGFGFALTGGSAQLLHQKLSKENRSALLRELFLTDGSGIGISYLRVSIGSSDLDDHVFSYDDLSVGQTDETLSKFSLDPDRINLIPVLKEILTINPNIKILGSPWSPPTWMKTNGLAKGGSLKPEYYSAYAKYLVKYIQEMKAEGIVIDAITTQNEPEHPGNTPSMTMTSAQQNEFIKLHLGPAFRAVAISTKIILYDHNCDHPDYPISILSDPETKSMVDGSAFHMYLGDISALSTVHDAHPDKNVYLTEQWTSGKGEFGGDLTWHVKNLVVGAPRNWSRNVLEWNLAADENFNPHTDDGGCGICQGAITINSKTGEVSRNVSYYIIAHASKFVPPGSIRIGSNIPDNLYNVAFLTPEGKKVLIVVNDNNADKIFYIRYDNREVPVTLSGGSVGTFTW